MTVDILPQRVFSLGHLFILQLSCPGLVLTGHLGHTSGRTHRCVSLLAAPPSDPPAPRRVFPKQLFAHHTPLRNC